MEKAEIVKEFKAVADTPAHIRRWVSPDNEETRKRASLENKNEFHLPSGRYNAEGVLDLLEKKSDAWNDEDYEFAQRVVNYAHRSAGIAEHHPHNERAEVGDTGMTKNEIARQNWGLPAKPKS